MGVAEFAMYIVVGIIAITIYTYLNNLKKIAITTVVRVMATIHIGALDSMGSNIGALGVAKAGDTCVPI